MTQTDQVRADMQALAAPKLNLDAAKRLAADPPFNAILHSTCVATMLSGGHQENALAQSATATVQCRLMPDETVDGTKAAIEAAVADPGITVNRSAPWSAPANLCPILASWPQCNGSCTRCGLALW